MSKTRSIFEDVADKPAAEAPPAPARRPPADRRGIAVWLAVLFALIVAMIVVGGMTRLTESGLSITEWRPVTGALPPTTPEAWTAEFEKYRATPQYEALNRGMTLDEFKSIYWWEWGHRQLGRAIGLVWGAGFLWFWLRRRIPPGWTPRLLGLGALGGLQGAIGWWMVRSGLAAGMDAVASYRLAVHLGLAFLLLGLIAWYVLRLGRPEADLLQARRQRSEGLIAWATVLVGARLRADPARGAGRRHRRRAQLHRLAADGGRGLPLGRLRARARLVELPRQPRAGAVQPPARRPISSSSSACRLARGAAAARSCTCAGPSRR